MSRPGVVMTTVPPTKSSAHSCDAAVRVPDERLAEAPTLPTLP